MQRIGVLLAAVWSLATLAGCSSTEVLVAHTVGLDTTETLVPDNELLDVAVVAFDPGVPDGEIDPAVVEELLRDGTFVQIRRMESLYMPVVLRDTLQRTKHWGAAWVTPYATQAADLNITGEILQSDGDVVELRVKAVDATGRVWLDGKYDKYTARSAFNRQAYPELDPYQDVFTSVANDLARVRASLSPKQVAEIREVSALRYAAELSPEAFSAYVDGSNGRYALNRLPATGDPIFDRTQRIRQSERVFIETLEQHYEKLYREAQQPYDGWREVTREQVQQLHELKRSTRVRRGLGIATIIASIAYGMNSSNDGFSDRAVRDALMYVGVDLIRTGALRREERRIFEDTLEELSMGFDDDLEPLVVEVLDTEYRLTGTTQQQHDQWRQMLRDRYFEETGFVPEEISIYIDEEEEPALEPGVDILPAIEAPTEPAAEPATVETRAASDDASVPFQGGA
jgi:hypothetical protein